MPDGMIRTAVGSVALWSDSLRARLLCASTRTSLDADTWRPVRSAFIRARFGGTCFYRLACDECKKAAESSSKSHAFLALDLTVCSTLEQALRKYRAAKEIGYRCEHCPCAVGLRHIEIRELPLVLCLQFKRYRFAMSGTTTKLDGAITFPEFLDETIEAIGEVDGKCRLVECVDCMMSECNREVEKKNAKLSAKSEIASRAHCVATQDVGVGRVSAQDPQVHQRCPQGDLVHLGGEPDLLLCGDRPTGRKAFGGRSHGPDAVPGQWRAGSTHEPQDLFWCGRGSRLWPLPAFRPPLHASPYWPRTWGATCFRSRFF